MLSRELRDAVTAAFRDKAKLAMMSQEEREQAVQWYERLDDLAVESSGATGRFSAGESVTLRSGYSVLDLQGNDQGVIGVLYNTHPPVYEVTWRPAADVVFDAVMYEDELAPIESIA